MSCVTCGAPAPEGFTTCSNECAAAIAVGAPQPEGSKFDLPDPSCTLTREQVSDALRIPISTITRYTLDGLIPVNRTGPRTTRYNLERVKEALLSMGKRLPEPSQPSQGPAQAAIGTRTELPPGPSPLAAVRARMLAAAKEAARDVVLEAADEAKALKDHELRAQYLDDFIHLEEGLRVVFNERGRDG